MASREELLVANAAIHGVLDAGAEARLRSIPGVEHVSVGLKVSGGSVTDELCIHVYVVAKRPNADLGTAERIPERIDGIRTDVNELRKASFTIDTTRYRPLKGGSMIGNEIVDVDPTTPGGTQKAVGTFGCTATRTSDDSPVLLSNWHILSKNGARVGEPIFQPPSLYMLTVSPSLLPRRPVNDDDVIAHIVEGTITSKVDAGIAKLDVSSCCRCCGLDFRDEIVGLSEGGVPPSNGIIGQRAAVPGSTVIKVGAASGRTVGRIVTASRGPLTGTHDGVDYTLTGQIDIASQDTSRRFTTYGDSGAVLVDEEGYVVGLLFGEAGSPPDARSYANHIEDVTSELGITLNVAEGHSTAGARVARPRAAFPRRPLSPSGQELYAKTRARVESDPAGEWLWALAEEHREEIVTLITTQRRVSVVWHRAGGPAIFAEALNRLRSGDDETLPTPSDGGTLEDAMARVGNALATHGSETLKAGLTEHRDALLTAACGSATLTAFLDKLRPYALARTTKAAPADEAAARATGEPA